MKKKRRIILIGFRSFIQTHFYKLFRSKHKIIKLKFSKINNFKFYENDVIINCSNDKEFFTSKYTQKNDRNLIIAKKLKKSNSQLVLLSSRNVYKPQLNLNENSSKRPIDLYGNNCLISEYNCKKILSNLTILRISNIVGLETLNKKRSSLMGVMIDGIKKKQIKFDASYQWNKDLIPIRIFCLYLEKILLNKYFGILNVGSGCKIKIKNFIRYLNLSNKIKISINYDKIIKNEYSYNINKLKKVTKIYFPKKIIINEFKKIGKLINK